MIQLSCYHVKKYYGTQPVLEEVGFEVQEGERVAIIGKNGSGKSTLLRLLTGLETPDEGSISIRKNTAIGYLEQIPVCQKGMTVNQICRRAFGELAALQEQMRSMEEAMGRLCGTELERMLARYNAVQVEFETKGGYETEERFGKICMGLKLTEDFLAAEFERLSGGERTLACLAEILLRNPDILILDEPTNHLDMAMLQWLEEYLGSYRGTVLMIAHDRYCLDAAATRVLELEDGRAEEYKGNYSYYAAEKERRRELQAEAFKEQQKQIKAMEKSIQTMRCWATQGDNEQMFKRAASMQKRLDKIERVERPRKEGKGMRISFDQGSRSGKDVLQLTGVRKSFGEKVLFAGLDLNVYYREHVALLGRNGCGKTTLLRMVLGQLEADGGVIRLGESARVGYLPQHIQFPEEELSVLQAFRDGLTMDEGRAREELSRYLFTKESVFKKVRSLSGGEKSRLYLAKLMQGEMNVLILDEPTNHLDIVSRENLEKALEQFEGTILLVSHDRYFLNKIATRIVELEEGTAVGYAGNFEAYKEEKKKRGDADKSSQDRQNSQSNPDNPTRDGIKSGVHGSLKKSGIGQKAVSPIQREGGRNLFLQRRLEREMEALEEQKQHLLIRQQEESGNYAKLLELETQLAEAEALLEQKLGEWLTLTEG